VTFALSVACLAARLRHRIGFKGIPINLLSGWGFPTPGVWSDLLSNINVCLVGLRVKYLLFLSDLNQFLQISDRLQVTFYLEGLELKWQCKTGDAE
jgi:hypothetical protein